MFSRPAEAETTAMSDPIPTSSAAHAAMSPPRDGFARVAQRREGVDACLYLFGLCKQLQASCLDRRGIDCLIDGDNAGRLPETVCRMLGLIVCELLRDASECTERATASRSVTVTLRQRDAVCLCVISGQGVVDPYSGPRPGLRWVQQLAAELDGGCMIRAMPDRGTVAVMFDVRLVESRLSAAIWRYRAGAAGCRAGERIYAVME